MGPEVSSFHYGGVHVQLHGLKYLAQKSGFVQSLEFLKKVLKFSQQFLALKKKIWKVEIKFGKIVTGLKVSFFFFFSKLQQLPVPYK